jgi:hypothetical protein
MWNKRHTAEKREPFCLFVVWEGKQEKTRGRSPTSTLQRTFRKETAEWLSIARQNVSREASPPDASRETFWLGHLCQPRRVPGLPTRLLMTSPPSHSRSTEARHGGSAPKGTPEAWGANRVE